MEWLGEREVKVSWIILPGDILERQKRQDVIDMAASFKATKGPINLPVVQLSTQKLRAGGDRMAAVLLAKLKKVKVRLVEGSEAEMEDLTDIENAMRRHEDRDAIVARMVARRTARIDSVTQSGEADKLSGSERGVTHRTAKGQAREEVARDLKTTPEAVRAAERRHAAAAEPEESPMPKQVLPPVEDWGLPLSDEELANVIGSQQAIDSVLRHVRAARSSLDALGAAGKLGERILADLRGDFGVLAQKLKDARPDALCCYCKNLPLWVTTCMACHGIGYAEAGQYVSVADELVQVGEGAVIVDRRGGFLPVSEARKRGPAGKPAPPARKLQLQDGDGKPIDPDDLV